MCNVSGIAFGNKSLTPADVFGKDVIEVGACDVNGSLRAGVEAKKPASYLGVDIVPGKGVDVVCGADELVEKFGPQRFDIVISTEMIEHVLDWRRAVSNLKNICRPGGVLIVTTRSKGFHFHAAPYDFWRYEIDDMKAIFSDFEIEMLEKDTADIGVFMKAHKPASFKENSLAGYALYNIVTDDRRESFDMDDMGNPRWKKNPVYDKGIYKHLKDLIRTKAITDYGDVAGSRWYPRRPYYRLKLAFSFLRTKFLG